MGRGQTQVNPNVLRMAKPPLNRVKNITDKLEKQYETGHVFTVLNYTVDRIHSGLGFILIQQVPCISHVSLHKE